MKHWIRPRLSLHNGVLIFVIGACLALLATYALQTRHARSVTLRQATRETTNLARSLSLQVADTFQIADDILLGMRETVEKGDLPSAELQRRLHTLTLAQFDGFPIIYALAVVDRDGKAHASTQLSGNRAITFRDREYYRFHRAHATREIHIGPPIRSKVDGAWIVTATRRFDRKDGTFAGLVEVKMSVRFFEHVYSGVDVGKAGIITLIRDDGTVLVRKPNVESLLGASIAKGTLYALLKHSPSGSATIRSVLDGVMRISAYRRVAGYPLVTIVALSKAEVLAEWESYAAINLALICGLVALIAVLGNYLASQIRQRQIAQEQLARLARVDGLTGLANRRDFDLTLERAWRGALRDGTPLALLMLDADHFKSYNDRYGHLEGDDALKIIARCIADGVHRAGDLGARYGGEEFAVLLPATSSSGAHATAERIRSAIAATYLRDVAVPRAPITVSVGVASMIPRGIGLQADLIAAADFALYEAKHKGRNRTEIHGESRERASVDLTSPSACAPFATGR